MSGQAEYDVVVVGAGIIGSATAYYLAKHGHKTLLLEQFMLPHTRGSSHGASRIIRKAYEQQHYAAMMGEAYEMWFQLEREAHAEIFKKTGLLVVGETGGRQVTSMERSLKTLNSPYDVVSHAEMRRRFPQFHFGESHSGIFDPNAGVLKAQRALTAFQEMFTKFGGTILDETKVTDVTPGSVVTVNTSRGQFKCKSVVFTVGPWAKELTKSMGLNLPIQPVRIAVCYWKEKGISHNELSGVPAFKIHLEKPRPIHTYGLATDEYEKCLKPVRISVCYWKERGVQHNALAGFPVFISHIKHEKTDCYGLPTDEYENCLKVCLHKGPAIDPTFRDATRETWDVDVISEFVKEHFPGVESTPAIVERCIYTMTPDEDFILDTLPRHKNVIIGAGFSGHGFKLAPVVGKVLAEMALGQKTSYPTTPFRMDRFQNTTSPKSHL